MTADEAAMLSACGLSEDDIVATAARLGGTAPIDEADAEMLTKAGVPRTLIDRLFVAEPTLRRLRRLAEKFEAGKSDVVGLSYLRPKGWIASEATYARGAVYVRFRAPERSVNEAPRELFIFVRGDTGLGRRSENALAEAGARMIEDALEVAGLRPRPSGESEVELGGRRVALRRHAGKSGAAEFEIGVAMRIDEGGEILGAGYVAPSAGRDEMRTLFVDFCGAITD
jgi:hypothetical protein